MKEDNILKYPPSHPVMFNGIFDDKEVMTDFLNSTGLFDIKDSESLQFVKQSIEDGIDLLTPFLDLRITIGLDTFLNLEMQNHPTQYDMKYRLGYYLSKLVSKSQPRGGNYKVRECSVFVVLNYSMFKNDERYLRTFILRDEESNEIRYFKIIALELTKIDKCGKNKLRKWMEFLNSKEPKNFLGDDEIMDKAIEKAMSLNSSRELDQRMDAWEKYERELASIKEQAEQEAMEKWLKEGLKEGRAKGLKEGRARGLEEGRAKGLEEGLKEGRSEGLKEGKILAARKMMELGLTIQTIIEVTGLTQEEIEVL